MAGAVADSAYSAPPVTAALARAAAWLVIGDLATAAEGAASASASMQMSRTGARTAFDLFRGPAGLADGLPLKEPAARDPPVAVRPNCLGPPSPGTLPGVRRLNAAAR